MRLLSLPVLISIAIGLGSACPLRGAVIYSGLENISIGTGFDGVYLDIQTGVSSYSGNWDINPFFGGVGVATNNTFQAARVGTGNLDAMLRFDAGATVGSGLLFSSGYGGSQTHLGSSPGQFAIGDEGYLAFRFITNDGLSSYYGWMRVVFTANEGGALIEDWAYEDGTGQDGAGSLMAGRVQQSPASVGVKLTTLSPGTGESFTLGSPVTNPLGGINVGSIRKIGAGATVLAAPQTYTGATIIDGGTLEIAAGGTLSGTASVAVNTGGTLLFSGPGGVNTRVNSAGTLNLGGGKVAASDVSSSLDQQFGVLTLSANSTIDFGTLAAGNTFRFAVSSAAAWTSNGTPNILNIWNWTNGVDHLFFGTSNSGIATGQLSQIRFFSDSGTTLLGSGFHAAGGEVISAVPEPGGLAVALGLLGLIGARENRRGRKKLRRGRAQSAFWNRTDGTEPGPDLRG